MPDTMEFNITARDLRAGHLIDLEELPMIFAGLDDADKAYAETELVRVEQADIEGAALGEEGCYVGVITDTGSFMLSPDDEVRVTLEVPQEHTVREYLRVDPLVQIRGVR